MIDGLKLDANEYLPLRDVVFKTLRQGILMGDIKPGERLMEVALAEQLGVSRTPIREAIRMLELEGLVTMVPRKGAEVAEISEKTLRDVLEVRCVLEVLAVDLAIEQLDSEDMKQLKLANKEFAEAIKREDLAEIARRDEIFHDIIYAKSNNQRLIQIINNLREQMYRFRLECIKDKKIRGALVSEHQNIIKELENKDDFAAKHAMEYHIRQQEITVSKNLKGNDAR